MKVQVTAKTDIGRVRPQNEDSYLTSLPLVAVADGMGGHKAGEVASSMALEVLDRWRGLDEDGGADRLRDAVLEANRTVWSRGQEDKSLQGMGTTLTAAWIHGSTATLAHVGDSRAYLLRDGLLSRLTEDHTLVRQMEAEGRIEPGEADRHPQRNILTQALGVEDDVDVEILSFELQPGDRLLLATDGLHGQINDSRIREILTSTTDPEAACATLVEEANAAGGEDNVTVVLVDAEPESVPAAVPEETESPRPVIVSKPESGIPVAVAARRRRRRRALVYVLGALAVVLVVAAVAFVRSGPRYFVGVADGRVAVLDGPLGAEPPKARVVRTTQIAIADVPPSDQRKLRRGIPVDSLAEASQIVAGIPRTLGETETTTPSPPPPPPPSPT